MTKTRTKHLFELCIETPEEYSAGDVSIELNNELRDYGLIAMTQYCYERDWKVCWLEEFGYDRDEI